MMPPYLKINDAFTALTELPSIRAVLDYDDENFLRTLLEISSGFDLAGTKVYRIFWVAAQYLKQTISNVLEESIYQESSVKYDKDAIQQVIEELLNLQNAQDLAYRVPTGFEALPVTMDGAFEPGASHWTKDSAECLLEDIEFYRA